jgi:hypothetical protein
MATGAFIGSQTILAIADHGSPFNYATIGEIDNISPIAVKKDLVEVTHLQSTAKEFIGGLSDGQEITIVCNFLPANQPQIDMLAYAATTSVAQNFKYTLPSASGGTKNTTFAGVVLSSSVGPTTPNTATKVTFGVKISGPVAAFA